MSTDLKAQLKADLTTSIKARDELTSSTLRMVLTAITNEEVSGKESKVLTDEEVLTVLAREGKKRKHRTGMSEFSPILLTDRQQRPFANFGGRTAR